MQIISYALAAAKPLLEMIEKYGWWKGGIAGAAVIVVVVVILKKMAQNGTKQEELSAEQSIGDGATTEGKMEFEDITQKESGQKTGSSQSIGTGAKSGKGMSFKNVRQEKN